MSFGEQVEVTSGLQGSAFFSSPFLTFWLVFKGLKVERRKVFELTFEAHKKYLFGNIKLKEKKSTIIFVIYFFWKEIA